MEPQTEQPDAFRERVKSPEQRLSRGSKLGQVRDRRSETLRARDDREIAELHLESHRAADDLGALDALPSIAGDPLELGREALWIAQVLVKGSLRAHRLVRPVGLDLAFVDPAADPIVPGARASELRFERGKAPFAEIGAGEDSERLHPARSDGADAVEARDRQ